MTIHVADLRQDGRASTPLVRFYMGLGPFIGYGLGGWYKNEDIRMHKVLVKGTVAFRGKDKGYLKDFDNGIGFLLGCRVSKRLGIHFIYEYGLTDIYKGLSSCYSRAFSVGIDYKIK